MTMPTTAATSSFRAKLLLIAVFAMVPLASIIAEDPNQADEFNADQVRQIFHQLGADEFAVRERAATQLSEMGMAVVPALRELTAASSDPEVKLRAGEIIQKLTDGDMAGRVEDFLAGVNVEFKGWRNIRILLGDSLPIRELFIELLEHHPDIVQSMEETTRDRVMALDKTLSTIEHKMFRKLQMPTQADTFAMFLPVVDPALPIDKRFEPIALSVLRREPATKIYNDAQLSGPFKNMLRRWIQRSSKEYRDNVLEFTMLWDMEIGAGLAAQTLEETHKPATMAIAMQAIARFGGRQYVEIVSPLLEDRRVVVEQGFVRGKEVQTLLCDVAAVTIARLYNVDLSELGYPRSVEHPTLSFLTDEIGFAKDESKLREALLEKIDDVRIKEPTVPKPRLPALR